jgi:hypothetical protein
MASLAEYLRADCVKKVILPQSVPNAAPLLEIVQLHEPLNYFCY